MREASGFSLLILMISARTRVLRGLCLNAKANIPCRSSASRAYYARSMREGRHTAKPEPTPATDPEGRLRRIEGRHHRLVKNLRQAFAKEDVSPEGYFGIEGLHLVEEAIRSGLKLGAVFFSASAQRKDERLFASAVRTERPQGVAALVRARIFRLEDVLERAQFGPIVVITGLQDPGNLGTIIRSAEAFEAAGVVLGEGTVSPLNGKAVRDAAGSLF